MQLCKIHEIFREFWTATVYPNQLLPLRLLMEIAQNVCHPMVLTYGDKPGRNEVVVS